MERKKYDEVRILFFEKRLLKESILFFYEIINEIDLRSEITETLKKNLVFLNGCEISRISKTKLQRYLENLGLKYQDDIIWVIFFRKLS